MMTPGRGRFKATGPRLAAGRSSLVALALGLGVGLDRLVGAGGRPARVDHLHPGQTLAGDDAEQAKRFAREETAGLGGAGAGGEGGVDRVDVEGEEDGLRVLPGDLEGHLGDALESPTLDVAD